MVLRRLHLIELHEQPWFPAKWRCHFQLALGRVGSLTRALDPLAERFQQLLARTRPTRVLELCSGSGEYGVSFWQRVASALAAEDRPQLVLSDLYPNLANYRLLKEEHADIDYLPGPINALDPPQDVGGVWMTIESLHHFHPEEVCTILRQAAEHTDGFAAFEITQRSWRNFLTVLVGVPLTSVVLCTVLLRPFRWHHLLWGLLLPVVPFTLLFDGLVSNLRSYSVEELQEITAAVGATDFSWEVGTEVIPKTGGLRATYLLGWRESGAPARSAG